MKNMLDLLTEHSADHIATTIGVLPDDRYHINNRTSASETSSSAVRSIFVHADSCLLIPCLVTATAWFMIESRRSQKDFVDHTLP